MKILIVFDSVYGNNEKVARAIGYALKGSVVVRASEAGIDHFKDIDGLIIGSPTHGSFPTGAMRSFLKNLPSSCVKGIRAAAYDTRGDYNGIESGFLRWLIIKLGSANNKIAKQLKNKGAQLQLPLGAFTVKDREGPLKDGELERAVEWAMGIFGVQPGR